MKDCSVQNRNGVPLLIAHNFEAAGGVRHAFSTRQGGVSAGGCASMNLSFTRKNDARGNVDENYVRICSTLGITREQLVITWQVHSDGVMAVDESHMGQGYYGDPPQADALITDTPGVVLTKIYADCVPVYLYDPARRAIGLAHAGWRGTALHIARKTAEAMRTAYGCRTEDLLAFIGPSIGPDHFEVDAPVVSTFDEAFPGQTHYTARPDGHALVDLWAYNRRDLMQAGLNLRNIACAELCTYCREDLFFSHRRDQGQNGLMAAFLMLEQV